MQRFLRKEEKRRCSNISGQSDERKAVAGGTAKTGTGAESGKTEAAKEKGKKEKND